MAFKPDDHFMKMKGNDYLPVVWRVVWVREEHPDALIDTEVVYWDHDKQEIMVRAVVVLPKTGARATGHCVGTLAEFKFGYVEKAETQAVGRALALLGYGTAFAGADLDEGERLADSPTAARNGGGAGATAPPLGTQPAAKPAAPAARAASSTVTAPVPPTVVPAAQPAAAAPAREPEPERSTEQEGGLPRSAADWSRAQLRARIQEMAGHDLKTGKDLLDLARVHGQPQVGSTAEMTQAWLLGLYQAMRAAEYAEALAGAQDEQTVTDLVSEALGERDRRQITAQQYSDLSAAGEARKAELSAPLLAGSRAQVAS